MLGFPNRWTSRRGSPSWVNKAVAGPPGPPGPPGPVGPSGEVWTKFTVTFQDFIDGGTGIQTLINLAPRRIIENAIMKCSIPFDIGGAAVELRLRAASASALDDTLIGVFDATSAITISNLAQSHFLYAESLNNSDVNLALVISFPEGGALGDLVAGSVDVWCKLTDLP